MKVKETYLGKVSVTAEGKWDSTKAYERLSLVYDNATLESYISKIKVPAGIDISNEDYWQPYSSFEKQLVIDYHDFQTDVLATLEEHNRKLKLSRIVVADDETREALTINDISVGCLVYVLDTKHSYILDSIDTNNNKTWHIYDGSLLGSFLWAEFNGQFPQGLADRAIADDEGNVIKNTYLTRAAVVNYTADQIKKYLQDNAVHILDGQITPSMLSAGVLQLIGNREITNLPDEEDITSVNNLLKFKDKEYNTTWYSGLARKYLRKNIVDGVNILTQDMIDEENTIYILQYDYCLNGETIRLPQNSIILWQGGSLSQGNIELNGCRIIGAYTPKDIFGEDITLDGDWACGQIFYHAMNLDEDGHLVEIPPYDEITNTNNFYWYWDGNQWVSLGFDISGFLLKSEFNNFKNQLNTTIQEINNKLVNLTTRMVNVEGAIQDISNYLDGLVLFTEDDLDSLFLKYLKKYLGDALVAGQNITITKNSSTGVYTISSSGGGGGTIDWDEVDRHISQYISQMGTDSTPLMTTTTAGKAKCGTGLKMTTSTDPLVQDTVKIDEDWLGQYIGQATEGATKGWVQSYVTSVLPLHSIILWDEAAIPPGWQIYTEAQGRYVIGAGPGVNVQDAGGTKTVANFVKQLEALNSKYPVSGSGPFNGFTVIEADDLPMHQHLMSIYKSRIDDNGFGGVNIVSWGHGYKDNDGPIFNTTPPTSLSSVGIYNEKAITGPNVDNNGLLTSTQNASPISSYNSYINIIPPSIALHYIKRMSNPSIS